MKVTKIGHCCLIIETDGKRIMTDPGSFTVAEHVVDNIDFILITHEHADHLHISSLKEVLERNPQAKVVTNTGVGELLDESNIPYQKLEGTSVTKLAGVTLEACDAKHAEIFEEVGQVQNTGYFINERLFYPGDAYAELGKSVEILALPTGGPWCRSTDALHYAIKMSPKHVFPVHDGIERVDRIGVIHGLVGRVLTGYNIDFHPMVAGDVFEF